MFNVLINFSKQCDNVGLFPGPFEHLGRGYLMVTGACCVWFLSVSVAEPVISKIVDELKSGVFIRCGVGDRPA